MNVFFYKFLKSKKVLQDLAYKGIVRCALLPIPRFTTIRYGNHVISHAEPLFTV